MNRRWARIRRWQTVHGRDLSAVDIHDLRFGDDTRPGSMSQHVDRAEHRAQAQRRKWTP